ncbi:hypothetical protein TMEN_2679 [Trichophyton mentagrophytes]|nr:hypothetical protein TMEN_2679 [Trichophyton mentagrophytes]
MAKAPSSRHLARYTSYSLERVEVLRLSSSL